MPYLPDIDHVIAIIPDILFNLIFHQFGGSILQEPEDYPDIEYPNF